MQTTSSTWKQLAALEYAQVETKAIINNVEYTGENMSPPVITRALMQNGVTIGNVVSAVCTFSLQTTNTIPKSAEVQIKMRLTDGAETPTTSEWLPCGTFYIAKRNRDPISGEMAFECYDSLLKGDAVWVPASSIWPQTMTSIVSEFLTILDLELDSRTTIDSTYTLPQPEAGATIRDVLGIIAQYHGANWTITPENKLRMVPIIDAADAAEAETDVIDVDAVVDDLYTMPANEITGIRCTYDDVTTLVGTDTGLVVDASIPGIIATDLIETIGGMEYQPYTLGTAYYDYAVELGDYVRYSDEVSSVLYSESVQIGPAMCGNISAPDVAEVSNEYPYIGNSAKALTIAKAYANEVVEDYDDTLTQQKVYNRLTNNGTAQGLVLYNGQLYMNATYINTGTLTADRISLNTYNPDFQIPDENDSSTLLPGQSISNGWVVQSGSLINVLQIPHAENYRGKTIEVSATTVNYVDGGYITWWTDDPAQLTPNEEAWTAPEYGRTNSDGTLSGATMNEGYYKYTQRFTIPSDAFDAYSVSFRCSGVKAITVSTGVSSELGLRYAQNISIDSTGLQVGKFVVNRTGDATFNGDVVFNGGISGVPAATQSSAGLMSASDKAKLDGIASGAQVNSITGVKGNAESSYRTGNVNLTPANIGAVAKSGDTMTGRLTFTATNAIAYQGTKALFDMIKFKDNTNDATGNGIVIGGGGATIIGGGESAAAAAAELTTGGSEILYLCNDGDVNVYSNMQDGWASRKTFTFGANGNLVVPSGCRIGESGGSLYLGNSGNASWVYVQDMASQDSQKWKIHQGGNAEFNGTVTAGAFSGPLTGNVTGNCSGSSGSCTGNAATATKATQDGSGNTITSKYTTVDTDQTISGKKKFTQAVQCYRYTSNNNLPAITMDKPGSYYVGIGADGTSNRIKFGPCAGLDGSAWTDKSTFNSNEFYFQGSITVTNPITIANGGTGATTAAGARSNLGILYKTVTGTTSSNGVVALGLSGTRYQVIAACRTDSENNSVIPYYDNNAGNWRVTIRHTSSLEAMSSGTSVTIKVTYIDFGSNI